MLIIWVEIRRSQEARLVSTRALPPKVNKRSKLSQMIREETDVAECKDGPQDLSARAASMISYQGNCLKRYEKNKNFKGYQVIKKIHRRGGREMIAS